MSAAPQFVLVKSASPRESFRRAGLTFTRDWRPLQLAETVDLERGVIDEATLKRLEDEPMLAVKPASADDVEDFLRDRAANTGKDKESQIAELRSYSTDLEARLMRLELNAGDASASNKARDAQIADLQAKLAAKDSERAKADKAKDDKIAELQAKLAAKPDDAKADKK